MNTMAERQDSKRERKTSSPSLRTGNRTPRRPDSSTPRSMRSTTPTHITDDEENYENLPNYMRPTAASIKKKKASNGNISCSFSGDIRGASPSPVPREKRPGSIVGSGIIPKGYEPGRVSPSPGGKISPSPGGKTSPFPGGKTSPFPGGKTSPSPGRANTPIKGRTSPMPAEKAPVVASGKTNAASTPKSSPGTPQKPKKIATAAEKKSPTGPQRNTSRNKSPIPQHTPSPRKSGKADSVAKKHGTEPVPVVIVDAAVDLDKDPAPEAPADQPALHPSGGSPAETPEEENGSIRHISRTKTMKQRFLGCLTPGRKCVIYE